MAGFLTFCEQYHDEATCIRTLVALKWPTGFICTQCQGRKAYHLTTRLRLFECAGCGHQHSVTAGTVFHKTHTPLRLWFLAAYLMGHDKRGVSALFLSRELAMRYDTAWLMCHKLRHALSESATDFLLSGRIELGKAFYGSRRPNDAGNRQDASGQTDASSQTDDRARPRVTGQAMVVAAVERVSASRPQNTGIARHGTIIGGARIAVLPDANADQLGGFLRANVQPGSLIVGNGCQGNVGLDGYKHLPLEPARDANRGGNQPIIQRMLSNIRTWLNGTYHGVSVRHLPRYLREWSYRFNRRGRLPELDGFVLHRAMAHATITYAELVAGKLTAGSA